MIDFLINIDTQLFLFLNNLHTDWLDPVMWTISATATWIPFYIGIIVYLFWKKNWKYALSITLAIIVSVALADIISVECFKNVFCRFRPTHTPSIADMVHTVNNYKGGKYGFVSSHAANCFAIATITSLFFKNKKFVTVVFVWAIIVSYSRIYLGVHFPGDIIGGAIVGSAVAIGIYYISHKFIAKLKINS